jgi:hypothetical protein
VGVLLQRSHRRGVAREFAAALVEGEVELAGEGSEVGRWGVEELAEGEMVASAEWVVDVVRCVGGGGKGGFGSSKPSERAVPCGSRNSLPCLVMPDPIRHPLFLQRRSERDGSRIKSGMTGEGDRREGGA